MCQRRDLKRVSLNRKEAPNALIRLFVKTKTQTEKQQYLWLPRIWNSQMCLLNLWGHRLLQSFAVSRTETEKKKLQLLQM